MPSDTSSSDGRCWKLQPVETELSPGDIRTASRQFWASLTSDSLLNKITLPWKPNLVRLYLIIIVALLEIGTGIPLQIITLPVRSVANTVAQLSTTVHWIARIALRAVGAGVIFTIILHPVVYRVPKLIPDDFPFSQITSQRARLHIRSSSGDPNHEYYVQEEGTSGTTVRDSFRTLYSNDVSLPEAEIPDYQDLEDQEIVTATYTFSEQKKGDSNLVGEPTRNLIEGDTDIGLLPGIAVTFLDGIGDTAIYEAVAAGRRDNDRTKELQNQLRKTRSTTLIDDLIVPIQKQNYRDPEELNAEDQRRYEGFKEANGDQQVDITTRLAVINPDSIADAKRAFQTIGGYINSITPEQITVALQFGATSSSDRQERAHARETWTRITSDTPVLNYDSPFNRFFARNLPRSLPGISLLDLSLSTYTADVDEIFNFFGTSGDGNLPGVSPAEDSDGPPPQADILREEEPWEPLQ